jgi:hypothetical protein
MKSLRLNNKAAVIFVSLASVVLFVLTFRYQVTGYDDGIVLTGAARVLRGDIPYRDFWGVYGPATFYFNAGVMALFGEYALVVKVASLFVKFLIVLVTILYVGLFQSAIIQVSAGLVSAGLGSGPIDFRRVA